MKWDRARAQGARRETSIERIAAANFDKDRFTREKRSLAPSARAVNIDAVIRR